MVVQKALGELKLIDARVQQYRRDVETHSHRAAAIKDPFQKTGGTEKFISERIQSINDLSVRRVRIRTAISRANLDASLTLNLPIGTGEAAKTETITRTVAEWLAYKRDVLPGALQFVQTVRGSLAQLRRLAATKGGAVVTPASEQDAAAADLVINIDEAAFTLEAERLSAIQQVLDTELSIFNATATVEIPD